MHTAVRLLVVLCLAAVAIGVGAGTVAAVDTPASGQFIIELDTDGDADAVFTDTFDLTDDDERAIFEDARDDPELRAAATAQFREEMQFVSDVASEDIDREIRVGEVTMETTVDGETGVVAYLFRWENLAAVEDDRIVLSEPFSTYDSLDRELVVIAPEGGELTSVSPPPQRQGEDAATWPGLTEFGETFEVVATVPTPDDSEPSDSAPATDDLEPISHAPTNADTYGGAPIALGVSVLLLASLLAARPQ